MLGFCILIGAGPRRLGAALVLLVLVVLALPWTADTLLASLTPAATEAGGPAQAIVMLSADMRQLPGGADAQPGPLSLDRLRTCAALQRRTGLPVLVSGGPERNSHVSLGQTMARSLVDDFGVQVRWTETQANDTWQNAERSAAILRADGITRVYLVTHSWHMRRAAYALRHFGIEVTPVPVWQDDWPRLSWLEFIPDPRAWLGSYYGLHEWIGLAYYIVRY